MTGKSEVVAESVTDSVCKALARAVSCEDPGNIKTIDLQKLVARHDIRSACNRLNSCNSVRLTRR